jgi:hypothetical protein
MWRISQSIGPITVEWKDIQDMICIMGHPELFVLGVRIGMDAVNLQQEEWIHFFEGCAQRQDWFIELWMMNPEPPLPSYYLTWQECKKAEFLAARQPYMEELMASSWNPKRALEWNVDVEEKRFILKNMQA